MSGTKSFSVFLYDAKLEEIFKFSEHDFDYISLKQQKKFSF